MNMAIKVAANTVISNTLELQNILTMDTVTGVTIQDMIKAVDHKLIIRDSAGNETFRIYGLPA
jgi:molybdenum cofactor biosynthesis enzyme|tara:strand:+ start:392 stop:580 length:189 start_codon:yes stop_codon:yes gene_type:complete